MFVLKSVVHYVDGHSVDVVSDQWSLGQWARYANTHGMNGDPKDAGYLSILFLRYCAYATLFRDSVATGRPTFETWDKTVIEVEQVDDEPVDVDPTNPAASGDS